MKKLRACVVVGGVLAALWSAFVAGGGRGAGAAGSAGQLAYSCARGQSNPQLEICSVATNGGAPRQITSQATPAVGPQWSPDGTSLAFVCHWSRDSANPSFPARDLVDFGPAGYSRNGGGEVCVVNPDGTGLQPISNTGGKAESPVWSPDGRQIAFAVGVGPLVVGGSSENSATTPSPGIWIVNVDGSGSRQVTTGRGDDFPSWSAGGQRIAFTSNNGVAVVNADGTGRRGVTSIVNGMGLGPVWSPDGRELAYTYFLAGVRATWVVNADGTGAYRVTSNGDFGDPNIGMDFTPEWSPDGTRLAVTTVKTRGSGTKSIRWAQVAVVPAAGGAVRVVSPSTTNKKALGSLFPAWSPDGTRLAFLGDRGGTRFDLFTVRANGADVVAVTKDKQQEFEPAWEPTPGTSAARLESIRQADLTGTYHLHLEPIPGKCAGLTNCNTMAPLDFTWQLTKAPTGYAGMISGGAFTLTPEGASYAASGELSPQLSPSCQGQPVRTIYEFRLATDAVNKAPAATKGMLRADTLIGSYKQADAPSAELVCLPESLEYAMTATRVPG